MKKKFCALLCVLVGTVSLVGCGSSSATKGEEYVTEDSSESDSLSSSTAAVEASTASSGASYNVEEVNEPELEASAANSSSVDAMTDDALNIVFLGDSQFDNARDSGTSISELVADETGGTAYNLGIGGTSASVNREQRWVQPADMTDPTFLAMTYALAGQAPTSIMDGKSAANVFSSVDPSKVDYYVIEYGVNDYFNGAQIYDDTDASNICTYVSALQQGLNNLSSISPNAKFVLISPAYSMFYNSEGTFIGDGNVVDKGAGTLSDYASACANTASTSGTFYIDAYFGGTFDLDQYTVDEYLSDGIHYTETGRKVVAACISHIINKDIGTDMTDAEVLRIDDYD